MPMTQVGYDYDSTVYYRARYYDPTIGRFISEDPIKFSGGDNFYRYAENDPVDLTDPSGETTYVCTAPLHALGDIGGKLAYYTLPFVGISTFHEYLCVWDPHTKKTVCGGQDQTGNWHGGPGKPTNDKPMERGGGCSVVNDQQCVDQCVTKAFENPNRPNYDLFNRKKKGENCQKWADDTLQSCVQQCIGKK